MTIDRKYCLLVGTALALGTATTSRAQSAEQSAIADASTAADEDSGEIVVTAQKREQSLNDVGLTIVALSGQQLQQAGVTDVIGLTRVTPGFTVAKGLNNNAPVYSIRGVGFGAEQVSASPTVSTYMDEASLNYPVMTSGIVFDLERVEVLKGPQGTLFGQNATGGSINFIAAKPTSTFSAGLRTSVGRFGYAQGEGFVSGPLAPTLNARIAATYTRQGDWQKSYVSDDSHGSVNRGGARLLLDWTPTDRIKLALNVNGFYDNSDRQVPQFNGNRIVNLANAAPGLVDFPLPPKGGARAAAFDPGQSFRLHTRFFQTTLRGDFELSDTASLTTITNYAHYTDHNITDIDGTSIFLTRIGIQEARINSFNQEARVTGSLLDDRLVYIVGGNYQHDNLVEDQINDINLYSAFIPVKLITDSDTRVRSGAVFANADFKITDQITLTGGIRYTEIKTKFRICSRDVGDGVGAAFFGGIANFVRSQNGLGPTNAYVPGGCVSLGNAPESLPFEAHEDIKDTNTAWRAGINFEPSSDALFYGLISRGYKSGGFSVATTSSQGQVVRVRQEEVTAYEVGAKFSFGRNSIAGAVFYYDYSDKQLYTLAQILFLGPQPVLTNIPTTSARGAEISATLLPFEGLRLQGGLTYSRTKVGSFSGFDARDNPVNFRGNLFNYAPKLSGTFDAEYSRYVTPTVEGFVGLNGIGQTKTFQDLANSDAVKMSGYVLLDARLGVRTDSGWEVSAWVRNLADKYYITQSGLGTDTFIRYTGMPRTFGLTVGVRM